MPVDAMGIAGLLAQTLRTSLRTLRIARVSISPSALGSRSGKYLRSPNSHCADLYTFHSVRIKSDWCTGYTRRMIVG
jgi:hypothetical protein